MADRELRPLEDVPLSWMGSNCWGAARSHEIYIKIKDLDLPQRIVTAIYNDLCFWRSSWLVEMSFRDFVEEVKSPAGGVVQNVDGIGIKSVIALRRALGIWNF
jgi:hypothetical protein